ncbi:MAG: hypothetical protein ABIC40_03665 [bacterium]
MENSDAIVKIKELIGNLSDEGIDKLVSEIADNEEILSRLLDYLVDKNNEAGQESNGGTGYINFLRKVKE